MDIHFTNQVADKAEVECIDVFLASELLSCAHLQLSAVGAVSLSRAEARRNDLLLPGLHAIHSATGWISPGALNYLCSRLDIPPAVAYGVATFYAMFSVKEPSEATLHVCDDIGCITRGADKLCKTLEREFGPSGVNDAVRNVRWKRSPCLGLCEKAPAALCQNRGKPDFAVVNASSPELLRFLNGGDTDGRLPGNSAPETPQSDLPLLARVGVVDPLSISDYVAVGGFVALRKAIEIGSTGVIEALSESKLSGRGGAAYPTGLKWKAVAAEPDLPHYIVCNADESEPGTFKDRLLLEEDPFAIIEAMTIGAFTSRAEYGYLYIRGEYPEATARLASAIEQCRIQGMLGSNVLGAGFSFDLEIRRGAGAYICGEETALLNSIEGKRGEPRNKPPYPVHRGLFGKPTVINNVETLANVLPILISGGAAYAAIGTEKSTGTRLFCVSGNISRPGVYELEYGAKLNSLIALAGGVESGRSIQAVLLGGAAGVFLRPDELDMELSLEGARSANATLGSGVVMIFDDTIDLEVILRRIAAFFRDESCGQCVPCRVGTVRQEEALHRISTGGAVKQTNISILDDLNTVMRDASICGLGQTASSAIASAIEKFGVYSPQENAIG